MAQQRFILANEEYYHVFNRGVARQPIFKSQYDFKYALKALSYYQFVSKMRLSDFQNLSAERRQVVQAELQNGERYVEIVAFVFMANHFHLLLKQKKDGGISKFVSLFCNSYSRYFNTKYQRGGPLFQGRFKSVHVETTEQLIHLTRYIHLNPVVSNMIPEKELFEYPFSSMKEYASGNYKIVNPEIVLGEFKSTEDYKKFVSDQVDYGKELEKVKHLILEE